MLLAKESGVIQDAAETVTTWRDNTWNWFTDMDKWMNVLYAGIKIIIIFALTRLFVHVVFGLIDRSLQKREKSRLQMNPRRLVTVGELLKKRHLHHQQLHYGHVGAGRNGL